MSIRTDYKHTIISSCAGYFVQAIINNFVPLLFVTFQSGFGFSYKQISFLILLNFMVQLAVDFLSAYFVDRIGYRRCIVAAHFLAAGGLVLLGVLPFALSDAYVGIVISILIYAVGSGLIEVIISPLVEACPTSNKSGSMSFLHSFYCWGQMCVVLFSTLFFVFFGAQKWRILSAIWALVPLLNAGYMMLVPFPEKLDDFKGAPLKELFKRKTFVICSVIMLCAGASEIAMSQWASAFAETGLHVSKTFGDLLGPCMFALLMGSSRMLYAKFSSKIDLGKAMAACSVVCIASYFTASFSSQPIVSLLGCALCGFSVGIMWPGTFSLGAEKLSDGGTKMFAIFALFGDLGCSAGPSTVGYITSVLGDDLKKGLVFAAAFPLTLLIMLFALKSGEKGNKR